MAKKSVWIVIALLFFAFPSRALAMSEIIAVTKETQAKQGLKFTLSAIRVSDTAVLVRIEIPRAGNLKTLKGVNLYIGKGNGSPFVSAALQTTPDKNGSLIASFQLSPELADKGCIELVTISPTATLSNALYYSVVLKGYITISKPPAR